MPASPAVPAPLPLPRPGSPRAPRPAPRGRPRRPSSPATPSRSPATRTTSAPPSGCATRSSPARWAPCWTARSRASTSTPSTRTATTCSSATRTTGQVVGTYRLLPPDRAAVAGRLYSEGEFDLAPLAPDPPRPGRGRPLLRPPRPPQRRRHRPDLGRASPATWPTRPRLAGRLLLDPARRRRHPRGGHLVPGAGQAPRPRGVPGHPRSCPGTPTASPAPPRTELPAAAARLPPPRRLGVRASPPTTPTSVSPTCTCCSRCAGPTRATCKHFLSLAPGR